MYLVTANIQKQTNYLMTSQVTQEVSTAKQMVYNGNKVIITRKLNIVAKSRRDKHCTWDRSSISVQNRPFANVTDAQ